MDRQRYPDRSVRSNHRLLVKMFLRARDGSRCHYCRRRLPLSKLTIDHKIPLMRGGKERPDNVVLACDGCNYGKGPMTEQEYKRYGAYGGRFLILLDSGHYKPIPKWATWPKGQYAQ